MRTLLLALCLSLLLFSGCTNDSPEGSPPPNNPRGDSLPNPNGSAGGASPSNETAGESLPTNTSGPSYAPENPAPPPSLEKINSTPDLTQTDPGCNLPNGGGWHCGPTAASNALIWLAENGYPALSPDGNQCLVAETLSEEGYMNANTLHGTGPSDMIRGLSAYLSEKGYSYSRLDYQGWRALNSKYTKSRGIPSTEDICESAGSPSSAVLINNGWYTYNSSSEEYLRVGGHWITIVGCEEGDMLIAHDPAPRAGSEFANEYITLTPIPEGRKLTGGYNGMGADGIDAEGFCLMEGGMHIKSIADVAILDGAVILEMG